MKTKEMNSKEVSSKEIQLIDGEFLKHQALEIISTLIDQKINYHKIEGMQLWESDHNIDKTPIHGRIEELQQEKQDLEAFIKKLEDRDVKLKVNGVLEIEVINN